MISIAAEPLLDLDPLETPPFPVRRFTVDEYHLMIHSGIFLRDDRFELLEGWILSKMPRNPPHDATLDQAQDVVRGHLPEGWRVRVQLAITTGESEPEPDLAIVPGPASRSMERHPTPQEVAMAIEVSNTSLAQDRALKGRIYARASILIYWIINLVERKIEVYTDPTGPDAAPTYRTQRDYGPDKAVPLVIAGREVARIAVRDLLP